jgi:hypothetical protein
MGKSRRAALGLAAAPMVAAALLFATRLSANAPDGRYLMTADGVKDQVTGLTWQEPDDGLKYTWQAATTRCRSPWRLPSVDELLLTLMDPRSTGDLIDPVFTNAHDAYWSATPSAGSATRAWYVAFYQCGENYDADVTGSMRVRCVR